MHGQQLIPRVPLVKSKFAILFLCATAKLECCDTLCLQTSTAAMSASMKDLRNSMEENEQLKVLMAGFRGSNLDESDFASAGVQMQFATDFQDSGLSAALPLSYDPDVINRCDRFGCSFLWFTNPCKYPYYGELDDYKCGRPFA